MSGLQFAILILAMVILSPGYGRDLKDILIVLKEIRNELETARLGKKEKL